MQAGEEERLITDNEKHRIYMRAVRGADGQVLGYYERYERAGGVRTCRSVGGTAIKPRSRRSYWNSGRVWI